MNSGSTQSVFVARPVNLARHVVETLFRHRALFAAVAGTVLFLTFLVTIATPAGFQSEMHLLVLDARPGYVDSEIDLLRSQDVADLVVDPDWTKTPLAQHTEEGIRQHERSVTDFASHLTVEPLGTSNVIRVTYMTNGPHQATETLDRLLQAFRARQHEIADAMNRQMVNVAVAERPTFSTKPYRPQILLNFALGLVTALLFAFTAVFLTELARSTVATASEPEAIATAPLIAPITPRRRRFTIADEPGPAGGLGDLAGAAFEQAPAFSDILRSPMTHGALALAPTFAEDAQLPIWPERAAATAMVETQPRSLATRQPPLAIEQGDPCHRRLHRPLNDPLVPARSNLSPSQRAQFRRPAAPRESKDRAPYVTYIVDPRP